VHALSLLPGACFVSRQQVLQQGAARWLDWLRAATSLGGVSAAFLPAIGGAMWSEAPTVLDLNAATGYSCFYRQ